MRERIDGASGGQTRGRVQELRRHHPPRRRERDAVADATSGGVNVSPIDPLHTPLHLAKSLQNNLELQRQKRGLLLILTEHSQEPSLSAVDEVKRGLEALQDEAEKLVAALVAKLS